MGRLGRASSGICAALCCALPSLAQNDPPQAPPAADTVAPRDQRATRATDPYTGFVTDSTVTVVGQEFYRAFVSHWREMPRVERYVLSIVERPSARWGSLVWVEYRQKRIYSTFLSPARRDFTRSSAESAALSAYQNVVDADVERLLIKDADLAQEEL